MTMLADLPTLPAISAPSGGFRVEGPSALVPGTQIRLPVRPDAWSLSLAERCPDCAATGVFFYDGALTACFCVSSGYIDFDAAEVA